MSIPSITLGTLLKHLGSDQKKRSSAVQADARTEVRKRRGLTGDGGGDFQVCFWSDVKKFTAGQGDLHAMTAQRIADAAGRQRLYPQLADGFLAWWQQKRRWVNEDIRLAPLPVNAPYDFIEIEGKVKVNNILALEVGGDSLRLIYPYFSEKPVLTPETARLGLWLMSKALKDYDVRDMRILDVLRGEAYSIEHYPLIGDEERIVTERYARMIADWRVLVAQFEAE